MVSGPPDAKWAEVLLAAFLGAMEVQVFQAGAAAVAQQAFCKEHEQAGHDICMVWQSRDKLAVHSQGTRLLSCCE